MEKQTELSPKSGSKIRAIGRALLWLPIRTWKATLVIFLLLIVTHGIATMILGRLFEADINAVKAKGEPVSTLELGGAPVPNDQNAALIYAKAFKMFEASSAKNYENVLASVLSSENGTPGVTAPAWSDAETAAQYFAAVVPLVQNAQSRPQCKFPVNWKEGCGAFFPHFASLRGLVRVLSAQAIIDARNGRTDEALRKINLASKAAKSISRDPIIISTLVSIACATMTNSAMQAIIKYSALNESRSKELFDMLSEQDFKPELVNAMKGERAFGLWAFNHMLNQGASAFDEFGIENRPAFAGLLLPVGRPFIYADGRNYLKIMTATIAMARKPYRDTAAQIDRLSTHQPRYALLSNMLLPVFSRASASVDAIQARNALTQILLAARVYKSKVGSYPDSIRQLRATLGWNIPKDIFSGKDLIYKRTADGFQVYSIGMDLKDDGGKAADDQHSGDIILDWNN